MKLYFVPSEFILRKDLPVPLSVQDKILRHHLWVLNPLRANLGCPVHISQSSGFRPIEHEKQKGRSGDSEHTFEGKGAVDLTVIKPRMADLAQALIQSPYNRICYYPSGGFFHTDYKFPNRPQTLFISERTGWKTVDQRTLLTAIEDS